MGVDVVRPLQQARTPEQIIVGARSMQWMVCEAERAQAGKQTHSAPTGRLLPGKPAGRCPRSPHPEAGAAHVQVVAGAQRHPRPLALALQQPGDVQHIAVLGLVHVNALVLAPCLSTSCRLEGRPENKERPNNTAAMDAAAARD